MGDAEPELHRGRAVECLGDVKTEGSTFDEADPGKIDAQTAGSLPPGVRVIAPAANAREGDRSAGDRDERLLVDQGFHRA